MPPKECLQVFELEMKILDSIAETLTKLKVFMSKYFQIVRNKPLEADLSSSILANSCTDASFGQWHYVTGVCLLPVRGVLSPSDPAFLRTPPGPLLSFRVH